ncbi:MAG: DUF1592 domain-containing protein [Pirellulaceae bacterium]|nr:DUF1592 domain-containing protein [Pirellulaceae bacterium]
MKSLLLVALVFTAVVCLQHAATATEQVRIFLKSNCIECHGGEDAAAGLDLESQPFYPADSNAHETWIKIHDRVAAGEMPPVEFGEVDAKRKQAFLEALSAPLIQAIRTQQRVSGRGVVRRLNRVEYETVLSDLLGIPLRIQERLPSDAKKDGFDTVGAALNVSSVQMEAWLETLDAVLDDATVLYEKPARQKWKLDYRDTTGIMQEYRRTGPFHILPDGVAFFAPEKHAHLNALLDHFTVPYSAVYRVKVSAYTIRSDEPITLTIRAGGPGHSESDEVPKTLLGHVSVVAGKPQIFQFEQRLQRGQFFRIYPASLPYMRFIPQLKERQKDYRGPGVVVQWVEVDGPIFASNDSAMGESDRFSEATEDHRNVDPTWPPRSHQQLWGGVKTQPIAEAQTNADPNEHLTQPPTQVAKPKLTRVTPNKRSKDGPVGQWHYDPKQDAGGEPIYRRARIPDPLRSTMRFVVDNPKAESSRLLTRFLPLAYRRPVAQAETQRFVSLVHRWLDEGDDFETAMRAGYQAVLTSPGFLYHQSSLPAGYVAGSSPPVTSTSRIPGPELSDHALAERLSFFLWNSVPDNRLLRLAATGELGRNANLRQQVERMLNDPKSERFVEDFLGQWLDLRQLEFTSPDSDLYPEHDPVLQWSFAEETHRFFRDLLDHDLSVRNIVDSNFTMVNRRLAAHYGIDGVDDMAFRKVLLPKDSVRGGVLTQASVLKVTANGTTTSPVVRGAWVLEKIIGKPADPPPPGIPAIEPDIRGATTVRQQLEQHRDVASCATCHNKIDPPGVALENFDVIGAWRDHYRALDPQRADEVVRYLPNQSVPIKYTNGLPVDASDQFADGRTFADIRGFKQHLLSDPDQIARNVIEKLVVYATGAPVSFADRDQIETIIEQTRGSEHGLRSCIHQIVQSEMFRSR